jgi:hypothetical protein
MKRFLLLIIIVCVGLALMTAGLVAQEAGRGADAGRGAGQSIFITSEPRTLTGTHLSSSPPCAPCIQEMRSQRKASR